LPFIIKVVIAHSSVEFRTLTLKGNQLAYWQTFSVIGYYIAEFIVLLFENILANFMHIGLLFTLPALLNNAS